MLKILVIGETCVDKFIYCNTERLSPEAPVPVLLPLKYIESPGMSGNVVRNISALNAEAKITHYHQDRIITKTRYVEEKSNHMFFRVDENEYGPYDQFKFSDIKDEDFDIVIVSDYDKGYLSNRDISRLCRLGGISILDSKRRLTHDMIDGYTWVKLNKKEAETNSDITYLSKMLITLGAQGVKYEYQIIPSPNPQETIDVSGAGDTFTAAFILKYHETKNALDAIYFANKKAAIVVSKRGVATP